MTRRVRWALVVVMLVVAGTVAVWPRGQHKASNSAIPPPSASSAASSQDDAALAAARRRAALQPCPTAEPGHHAVSGPLANVSVPCLGTTGTVDVATALVGRPALLNLWASWCVPCRQEMPVLAAYTTQPGAVAVLGVNVQDQPSSALGLLADLGVHYPSVTDPDGAMQHALRAPPVLPVSYLLRADGSVRRITRPLVFNSPEQVRDATS
jgi:thiol-disulfide isomerase/thioredoxin